ncbi:diguanylate cyclase [Vibrio sp. SCSIO 43140]|uniref:sensor domain-containing diguanylate cyclase n=1 Tax=Vibrio sp. SCSIO 43140 TaxID=2819100 RepID=UPI0020752EF9|nr:sensor domain-containing diguanylate cyclase [Vibrio sp. SCSIO 43140]USD63207.1 diguanylate cyclase [Vibrio sp. SCSIO 43140]
MPTTLEEVYQVLSCLPDPVFILSEDGEYVDILGGTDSQSYHDGSVLVGQSLHEVLPKDKADWFISQIVFALDHNEVITVEYDLGASDVDGLDEASGPSGTLRFEGKISPLSFTRNGRRVACWLTRNISTRYHLEKRLRKQSETDSLTHIANRRFFFDTLKSTLASKSPSSLILFDIDYFKNVNDTHGHLAGDLVLKQVAKRVNAIIRPEDTFARVGGEEFAVLLPRLDREAVTVIAERLREAIDSDPFLFEGQQIHVTASFGVTRTVDSDQDTSVFSRVDTALYQAKLQGRNQVVYMEHC